MILLKGKQSTCIIGLGHFSTATQALTLKKDAQVVHVAIRFHPPIVVEQF